MVGTSNVKPIYLDGFSTMPLAPEARAAMTAAFDQVGNALSPHSAGEAAAASIAQARLAIADLINAAPAEIIFTSGATEANNLAILGVTNAAVQNGGRRRRVIVSAIEHKATLEPARRLANVGFDVIEAPVGTDGVVDLQALGELINAETLLVSVMAVNNETGLIQPVAEIAELTHQVGALLHCDAAQAVGKIDCDVHATDVDYLSISSHKLYGPMGVGALYCAASAPRPEPLFFGGGQQSGIRPGTEPVALISGFGAAALVATRNLAMDAALNANLLDRLLAGLTERQVRYTLLGKDRLRVPGGAAIALDGIDAEMVCTMLARKVHLSTGSACTAGQISTSHVLDAMGLSVKESQSVIRFMANRYLTLEHIDQAVDHLSKAATRSMLATGEVRQ